MAATNQYGLFWDSNSGDRVYNAESFELWLKKFFYSGVFANEFETTPVSGMNVSVSGGYANVDGKVKFFDDSAFTITAASASYPRYDAIAIERNDTNRNITMKVVTGSYSGSAPQKPTPVRTGGVYQLIVAYIYVPAGATAITQAQIVDSRGDTDVCGYVTGTVDQLDFDSLMNQFSAWLTEQQDDFDTWFDNMKDQLSTDAAGHLQNEIDDINDVLWKYATLTLAISHPSGKGTGVFEYSGTVPIDGEQYEIFGVVSSNGGGIIKLVEAYRHYDSVSGTWKFAFSYEYDASSAGSNFLYVTCLLKKPSN